MATKVVIFAGIVAIILWIALGCVTLAHAQVEVPDAPSVQLTPPEGLRRGQAAPRDGLFVDVATYLGLTSQIERLEHLVGATLTAERSTCERLVEIEHLRTVAAQDALTLHTGLWGGRQSELVARVEQERLAGQRQWYEAPLLWFIAGAALVGVVVGILAAAFAG